MPRVPHSTDDLAAAELELRRAMLHADLIALDALIDEEAELVTAGGGAGTKRQELEAYRSGRRRMLAFEVERSRVRVLEELGVTDIVATVCGTDEGAPFAARLRYVTTWRLGEDWTVVARHVSRMRA